MAKRSSPKRQQSSSSSCSSSDSEKERRRQKKLKDKEKSKEKEREREREKEREKEKDDRAKEKDRDRGKDKEKDKSRERDRRRRSPSARSRSSGRAKRRSRSEKSGSRKPRSKRRSRSRKSRSRKSRARRSRSRKSRSRKSRARRSRSRKSRSKRSRSRKSPSKKTRSRRSRSRKSRSRKSRSKRRSRSKRSRSSRRSVSRKLRCRCGSSSSSGERKKEKTKEKKGKKEAVADKPKVEPVEAAAKAPSVAQPPAAKKPLGDLAELQKQLEEERDKLQLYVLKAKQEHEEKRESDDRRERREKEYYKPSWGEPVGPENRFLLEGELGKGAFSTVFRCRDALKGGEYAVKFIRMNAMLRKATEKEVKLMRRLRTLASEQDPEGARHFLGLAGPEVFEHEGHLAVVFQLQRCDLRSGLAKYGLGKGLPLTTVQCYASNIFLALRALKKVNIIHSDVKPDNLLITLDKASVKLSDFGSAMGVAERVKTDYVQPRFYRAPEVILGQAYGTEIDTWSAALTLFELATGRIALQGRTNNDMIHEMLKVTGAFPKKFATSGDFAARHFTKDGDFKCQEPANGAAEVAIPMDKFPKQAQPPQPFQQLLEEHIKEPPPGSDAGRHQARLQRFADLLARCVVPVPAERLTPQGVLAHAFLQNGVKS